MSYGETGFLTSLIEWLDEMGLGFCVQGLCYNSPMAKWVKVNEPTRKKRRSLKKQSSCYRMAGEMDLYEYAGENIPVRAGQYWESPGALMEIVSFNQDMGSE